MSTLQRYKCLVIDDERHAIELLTDYIEAVPQLYLARSYQDPVAALMESDSGERYDFIFLDVDMPRLSGMELARVLRPLTSFLVFTTAHPKYAVDAFDIRADHFLLKPIGMNKFALTVNELLKSREAAGQRGSCPDSTFFIKSDQKNKLIRICFDEIIAVEGLKNYVQIYTSTQKHIAYLTMKETEDALRETERFLRVHRSFIIAKNQITAVHGRTIQLKGGLEVPVGELYKKSFDTYIAENSLFSQR